MELYNDPNITSKEFLYAVMHDPKVDIVDRVKAAAALMEIEPHGPPRPSLTIQIQCISDDDMKWLRLSEQDFRFDRWSICRD